MKVTIFVVMMGLAVANAAIYRASNLGVVHEVELPEGFEQSFNIENIMPVLGAPMSAPAPMPVPVPVPAPAPTPVFAPASGPIYYKATNLGSVHEVELPAGFEHSFNIDNLMPAPGAAVPAPVPVPMPAPVPASVFAPLAGPLPLIYRASNLGVVHQAELPLGYPQPIYIDNLMLPAGAK